MIELLHTDCMKYMATLPDNAFDLAIVDPPYGGGCGAGIGGRFQRYDNTPPPTHTSCKTVNKTAHVWDRRARSRFGGLFAKHKIERTGGTWAEKYGSKVRHWDVAPPPEYFAELFRVSKNQIIWGGNYFGLPPTRCFVVWRKLTISESFTMAMAEYAWTSFDKNAKLFEAAPQGTRSDPRIHPTQKPVKLYKWLLKNYASPGDRILDTHLGSGSIAIACHELGFDLTGCEIDPDYYASAKSRLEDFQRTAPPPLPLSP